jgi:hypothetical protein
MSHLEKFREELQSIPPFLWIAILAAALVLPQLGSYGFWDPWELKIAEHARDMVNAASLLDVTVGKRFAAEPPLGLILSALGMRLFSVGELGGRFANAVCAIVAILAVYWAGLGLFRRRAAVLAVLALVSLPVFVLEARQLVSDMPLIAALALALGGLGRYAWPADGLRRMRDLAVAVVGMGMGLFAGGALLGVVLPCLALAGTMVVGYGLRPRSRVMATGPSQSPFTADGIGPDVPADTTFGRGLFLRGMRGRTVLVAVAATGILLLVLTLTTATTAGRFSLLLGGTPRAGTPSTTFEFIIRQLGFGLFPWSAFAVFALGRPMIRLGGGDEPDGDRLAFAQLYLLFFATFAFALSSLFVIVAGEARFVALAAVALAIGSLLDEALEGERAEPVLGLMVATGTMLVARDLDIEPQDLIWVHTLAKIQWPPTLSLGPFFLLTGLLFGGGIYAGFATRGRALGRVALRESASASLRRKRFERAVIGIGRYGIHWALASALVFSMVVAFHVVPSLSTQLSLKPLLQTYTRFAVQGEKIGRYKVEAPGAGLYNSQPMVDLPTQERLAEFLRAGDRVFALVPTTAIGSLDAELKTARVPYFVVNGSSSRFLLLSNHLKSGEKDENPLNADVWMAPQLPKALATPLGETAPPSASAAAPETKWPDQPVPWKWRIPARTMFEDAIELIGVDYPPVLRRPGKIHLSLFFRVHKRPKPGFRVFVHFDSPTEPRILGDHALLNGTFPTEDWLPGEYIRDRYDVDVPLMTTPAGKYTVLIGFWPGGEGKRLKITAGNDDGADRTQVGIIDIK